MEGRKKGDKLITQEIRLFLSHKQMLILDGLLINKLSAGY